MFILSWFLAIFVLLLAGLCCYLYCSIPRPRKPTQSEGQLYHPFSDRYIPAPSINDNHSCAMTLVIPAYNETKRIRSMLADTTKYIKSKPNKTFEILVVDDGSKDGTTKVVSEWARENKADNLFILTLEYNRGKGGAVTQGMLHSRGRLILFLDADGASNIDDLTKLENAAVTAQKDEQVVVIGSRHHLVDSDAVVQRSALRNFLMHSFHMIIYVLGVRGINDTQCGFKLFSRRAARVIFRNMHVEGWIFDIELLLLARWFGIPIVEIPIGWHEVEGSKMSLLKDSLRMLRDLLIIRICYQTGYWTLHHKSRTRRLNDPDPKSH